MLLNLTKYIHIKNINLSFYFNYTVFIGGVFIAAYVWPAYTGDEPRTKMFWDEGIGEWQTVRDASSPIM